jgi:hypothetical protein
MNLKMKNKTDYCYFGKCVFSKDGFRFFASFISFNKFRGANKYGMKNVFSIFVIMLVVSLSCTENKMQKKDNPDIHVIDIDIAEQMGAVNTSQLFKKVTPIILEVTSNSLIKGF